MVRACVRVYVRARARVCMVSHGMGSRSWRLLSRRGGAGCLLRLQQGHTTPHHTTQPSISARPRPASVASASRLSMRARRCTRAECAVPPLTCVGTVSMALPPLWWVCTRVRTHVSTCRSRVQNFAMLQSHESTSTHTHTHTCACARTLARTHTRSRTNTQTHKHAQVPSPRRRSTKQALATSSARPKRPRVF